MPEVIIRPIDLPRDAEGLAAMWNATDSHWPWGWTRGVPATAQTAIELEQERRHLVTFVAVVDGEIAGYCSFTNGYGGYEEEGYLALLNVHPRYHKQSIGRKLIQATIARSVEMGQPRQTLHTWSANFKAVPAYKKTGHFWAPNTSVLMDNFIPGALQMPLAQPFFARHDWYSCYVREIAQEQDIQSWEGVNVYTERWEADGEALTIWIHREARAPLAIETDAVSVAALPQEPEPLAGHATTLRWRIHNKGTAALHVHLHALGERGLNVDHRDLFSVPAGETVECTATVQVAADAPRSKDDGTVPSVRSLLRLDETELELFTGLRPRQPLALDTAPGKISLRPGVATTVGLQVHSELPEAAEITLRLTPPPGLEVAWTEQTAIVEAVGHLTLPLRVQAAAEGVYRLPLHLSGAGETAQECLTLFAVASGGLVAQRLGNSARLENDTLRVTVEALEGVVSIEHKPSRVTLATVRPQVMMPSMPSELQRVLMEMTLEQREGRATVRLVGETRHCPGLFVQQEFTLGASGLSTWRCTLENRGTVTYTKGLRLSVSTSDRLRETRVLPLTMGIVRAHGATFCDARNESPTDPADYAEPWLAWERGYAPVERGYAPVERDGVVGGLAWDETATRINAQPWNLAPDYGPWTLGPGARSPGARLAVQVGEGDWRVARRALLAWARREVTPAPEARPVVLARLVPEVIATTRAEVVARLVVDSASARAVDGEVTVITGEDLFAEPARLALPQLRRGQGAAQTMRLTLLEERCGAFAGQVQLTHASGEEVRPFQVLRLGDEQPVRVHQGEEQGQAVWRVENGASAFTIAPGFGPGMVAWHWQGANQLHSAFPTPRGFSFTYPWFGGVTPCLLPLGSMGWPGAVYREQFHAAAVCAPDAQGLPWQGVRLSAELTQGELRGRGVTLEADYLTLGGSSVCKVVYRLRNGQGREQGLRLGSTVAAALGSDPTRLTLRGEGIARRAPSLLAMLDAQSWGALVAESGRTLLMVQPHSAGAIPQPAADAALEDYGAAGRLLGYLGEVWLPAHGVVERTFYLVLAASLEEAQEYLPLRDYQG